MFNRIPKPFLKPFYLGSPTMIKRFKNLDPMTRSTIIACSIQGAIGVTMIVLTERSILKNK